MKALSVIFFVAGLCCAQANTARVLGVRSLAMAKLPKLPERFVKTEEGYVELVFSMVQPSKLTPALTTSSELPLFERTIGSDGKISHQLAQQVKLPEGAKGVLLLGWMAQDGAKYLAIDDNYLTAKHNDWILINAATKDVAFQMGYEEKPLLIKANSVKKHRLNANQETGVSVIGQAQWGAKIKTFYSTYWPIYGGQRGIVIFYGHRDRIAVRRITDVLLESSEKVAGVEKP